MESAEVREIVTQTVQEMLRKGLLRSPSEIAYSAMAERLAEYYAGKPDKALETAILSVSGDYYWDVIADYYSKRLTINELAEKYDCEPSTIKRNKKRLCLRLYRALE